MAFERKLVIPIIGDARSFEKAIRKSIQGSDRFHSRLGRLTKGLAVAGIAAAGAGAAFAVGFGIKAVQAAASLQQSMMNVNSIFGKSAGIIRRFSLTTANALGINRDQSLEFASGLGLVMTNLGMGQQKAAALAKRMVVRASDVALLNKADPADVISGFQRGLTGMTRGLKKYGIVVDATSIKNEAIRSGIAEMTVSSGDVQKAQVRVTKAINDQAIAFRKYGANSNQAKSATANLTYAQEKLTKAIGGKMPALTPQQKMLATINLLFQKSQIAAGSSRKRIGTWGQIWKRIHASVHDLTEEFGLGLLPVVNKVAGALATRMADPKFRAWVHQMGNLIAKKLVVAFYKLKAAFIAAHDWFVANWPTINHMIQTTARLITKVMGAMKWLDKHKGPSGIDVWHKVTGAVAGVGKIAQLHPTSGGGVTVHGDIHVHGVDDPKKLAEKIKRQAKDQAHQTRGRVHGHPPAYKG